MPTTQYRLGRCQPFGYDESAEFWLCGVRGGRNAEDMPGIADTAYPRLKLNLSGRELDVIYTPNLFELAWLDQHTRQLVPRVGLPLLPKTIQRLGYFPKLSEVPPRWHHCAEWAGAGGVPGDLLRYDSSSVRRRHMPLGREFVGVTAWGTAAVEAY